MNLMCFESVWTSSKLGLYISFRCIQVFRKFRISSNLLQTSTTRQFHINSKHFKSFESVRTTIVDQHSQVVSDNLMCFESFTSVQTTSRPGRTLRQLQMNLMCVKSFKICSNHQQTNSLRLFHMNSMCQESFKSSCSNRMYTSTLRQLQMNLMCLESFEFV